jgi:maltooligosyltrehalose trehalohydrolase
MVCFRVWAPHAVRPLLDLDGKRLPMASADGGWWRLDLPEVGHGQDYGFVLDGAEMPGPDEAQPLPDPRSRWQPAGVLGPSRVLAHDRFDWRDQDWPGRALRGSVVYELHVGTFSPEGDFDGAAARLDHLVELGVDFVELLPVAPFPGRHGWGYDGVALFAVHEPYGGPAGLKRFVDAAHRRGLGVILDVVYNHLGPTGNVLERFGPYFTDRYRTPWGPAVNLDGAGSDEVRAFIVDSALAWLRDYHIDGLRLDAVHAFADSRATHILEELSVAVDALAARTGRPLFLIAESDLNDPRVVTPRAAGGHGVHAQWSDDFHHALHALLTGERDGYYADFGSIGALVAALRRVFVLDGGYSRFRGRSHGRPLDVGRLPGSRFVCYLQDHDQVGNRAVGDRISATAPAALLAIGATLVLTSPFTPMLFMGEEWAAGTPWQYFTDHVDEKVAERTRRGRLAEFAAHGWRASDVPDPQDEATFRRSALDWSELDAAEHQRMLSWYRRLIALRRAEPDLRDPRLDRLLVAHDEDERWLVITRGSVLVAVNLADRPRQVTASAEAVLAAFLPDVVVGDGHVLLPAHGVAVLRAKPAR